MDLHITHETRYDYTPAVENAQHMACLQPQDTVHQTVVSHHLDIVPSPGQRCPSTDVFGNRREFFSLQTPHEMLRVTAHSHVQTRTPRAVHSTLAWERVREAMVYRAGAAYEPASAFVFPSTHVLCHSDFADYARTSFTPGTPLQEAAIDLMRRMHHDLRYASHSTDISTPARTALAQRQGVCQDFAHIFISCLRTLGLPARYVSGYVLTQPPPGQARLVGSDASHAWASVFLPDVAESHGWGWYDLDPTNQRDGWGAPGEDYVTIAIGRDYADISPMRGVIHGGNRHTLSVAVTVAPDADTTHTISTEPEVSP